MTDVCDWLIMDDSDQDFTDLCSRLLKRVRKKGAGGSGDEKRSATKDEEPPSPSSRRNPPKRRKKTEVKSKINGRTQAVGSGDVSQPVPGVSGTEKVKDAVIRSMQRFQRVNPERLLHAETDEPTTTQSDGNRPTTAGVQLTGMVSSRGFQPRDPHTQLHKNINLPYHVS